MPKTMIVRAFDTSFGSWAVGMLFHAPKPRKTCTTPPPPHVLFFPVRFLRSVQHAAPLRSSGLDLSELYGVATLQELPENQLRQGAQPQLRHGGWTATPRAGAVGAPNLWCMWKMGLGELELKMLQQEKHTKRLRSYMYEGIPANSSEL